MLQPYISVTTDVVSMVLVLEREEPHTHTHTHTGYYVNEVLSDSKVCYVQPWKFPYTILSTSCKIYHSFSSTQDPSCFLGLTWWNHAQPWRPWPSRQMVLSTSCKLHHYFQAHKIWVVSYDSLGEIMHNHDIHGKSSNDPFRSENLTSNFTTTRNQVPDPNRLWRCTLFRELLSSERPTLDNVLWRCPQPWMGWHDPRIVISLRPKKNVMLEILGHKGGKLTSFAFFYLSYLVLIDCCMPTYACTHAKFSKTTCFLDKFWILKR
jgi:hypothetical protein